jgi:hypothetical protein
LLPVAGAGFAAPRRGSAVPSLGALPLARGGQFCSRIERAYDPSAEGTLAGTFMSIVERYLVSADDFEMSYVVDDWSRLAQYFTPNAVC